MLINSVYGKAMENLRKIINARLVNNVKDYKKHVTQPSFVSRKIFSDSFVAIHEIKPGLTRDKSIYVGFSILDLPKIFLYDFSASYFMLSCYLQTETV